MSKITFDGEAYPLVTANPHLVIDLYFDCVRRQNPHGDTRYFWGALLHSPQGFLTWTGQSHGPTHTPEVVYETLALECAAHLRRQGAAHVTLHLERSEVRTLPGHPQLTLVYAPRNTPLLRNARDCAIEAAEHDGYIHYYRLRREQKAARRVPPPQPAQQFKIKFRRRALHCYSLTGGPFEQHLFPPEQLPGAASTLLLHLARTAGKPPSHALTKLARHLASEWSSRPVGRDEPWTFQVSQMGAISWEAPVKAEQNPSSPPPRQHQVNLTSREWINEAWLEEAASPSI